MNYCKVEDIFKECESSGILTLWNFGLKPSQVEENILKTEQLMEISNEYLGYIKTDNSYEIIEEIVEDGSALVTFEVCTTINEYKSIICDMIVAIFKARNYFISVENGKIVTVISKSDFASSLYLSCDDNICCSNSEYDSETESDHSENLTQCLPSTPPLNEECNPNIPWGEDSEHESVHETEQHKEKEHRSGHDNEKEHRSGHDKEKEHESDHDKEKEHESDHDKEKEHESDHDNEKENESDHDNEKENESDHETEHNEKEHESDHETDQHNEPDSVKRIRLMGKYKSMKLVDLRFILQKRNIKKYGKKKVVIERLINDDLKK